MDLVLRSFWPILSGGIVGTIPLALASFAIGLVLALAVALMRLSRVRILSWIARAYISVIRGTPLLVQLFVIFYGLPSLGLKIDPWPSATIAFALNVGGYAAEVIPGVTAMSGSWSQAGLPLVQGDDVLSVLPGTLAEAELVRRLGDCEAAVIMKVGRNLPKIRRALAAAGKLGRAVYVERATMAATTTLRLEEKLDERAPYFSLVLVPGWELRP